MNATMNSFVREDEEKALLVKVLSSLEEYRQYGAKLHEDLFFTTSAKKIWQIIRKIEQARKEPTMLLVKEHIQDLDDEVMLAEWSIMLQLQPDYYRSTQDIIDVLNKNFQKRKMIEFRDTTSSLIGSVDMSAEDMLGNLTSSYLNLLNNSPVVAEMEYASQTMDRLYDMIASEDGLVGLSTGFPSIDDKVMGLKPGDLFVIGAQTSGGKTALALNIATNMAKQGKEVGIFSLEMRPEKLYLRIAATVMGVSANRLANQKYWDSSITEKVGEVFSTIGKLPIRMPPCVKYTIEKIVALARQEHQRNPLHVLVIDYLQIISDPKAGDNRASFISNVCSELKALAMSLGIPVIVLAQVSRKTNEGRIHKPELWHLKESGSIEQAADVVVLIHRNKWGMGSEGYDSSLGDNLAQLRIVKNREGECADVLVGYEQKLTLFYELDEQTKKNYVPTN